MGYPAVDRRRSPRVPFDKPIIVRFGLNELICAARDLSMGGILIVAPVKMDKVVAVQLKFIVPAVSSKHTVDSGGMVVHLADGPDATTFMGVEFYDLTFGEVRGIAQYVKARSGQRSQLHL